MKVPITRRQLLGGGLLLVGGAALAVAWGHRPLGTARTTLAAALDALLPEGAPADAVADDVQRFLAAGDPVVAGQLRLALGVLEHGCGLVRFSRLDRDGRVEVLEGWRVSSLGTRRQIADALRRVALFSWYSRPEAWAAIGYDGPWVSPTPQGGLRPSSTP